MLFSKEKGGDDLLSIISKDLSKRKIEIEEKPQNSHNAKLQGRQNL
jgi:hypothetical protein